MDIATLQIIGEYIVVPICVTVGLIAFLYFLTKD